MDEYQRGLLDKQDWDHLLEKLTLYANRKLIRLFWRGQRGGILPGGAEGADFALTAITRTFSGKRKWNIDLHPDILQHLFSAVDSLVSSAVKASDNQDEWSEDEQYNERSGFRDTDTVYQEVSDRAYVEGFVEFLQSEPDLCAIVRCITTGYMKREDIAEQTGMEPAQITNCQKRLERRLTSYIRRLNKS